jgi:CBS domain-containing protein
MKLDVPQPKSGLQERLMEDSISVLKPANAIALSLDSSVADAVEAMKQHQVGCLLVLDGARLTGIFSERDFLLKVAMFRQPLSETPLRDVMTPKPVVLSPDHSIRFALHEMSVGGFRHIPLVKDDRPVGIISVRDVISYLCRELRNNTSKAHAGVSSSPS